MSPKSGGDAALGMQAVKYFFRAFPYDPVLRYGYSAARKTTQRQCFRGLQTLLFPLDVHLFPLFLACLKILTAVFCRIRILLSYTQRHKSDGS